MSRERSTMHLTSDAIGRPPASPRGLASLAASIARGEEVGTPSPTKRLAAREEGMLTLTVGLVLIGFMIMIGLVANVARTTREKLEVQNAADAAAYSTALWLARGMNSITAANHMIGELTAICALHEAIGGKLLRGFGSPKASKEWKNANDLMQQLQDTNNTLEPIRLIDSMVTQMHSDNTPSAGAMLYDARMSLKHWCNFTLAVRALGLVLRNIPFTAPVGMIIYIAATVGLGEVYYEWLLMELVEKGAVAFNGPVGMIESQAIPALVRYCDAIAKPGSNNPMSAAVRRTVDHLAQQNRTELGLFPQVDQLALPVVRESPPRTGEGDIPINTSFRSLSIPGFDELLDLTQKVVGYVKGLIDWLDKADDVLGFVIPDDLRGFPSDKVNEHLETVEQTINGLKGTGFPENPSHDDYKLQVDWNFEAYSQWTRATYPYVNAMRRPIAEAFAMFPGGAPLSRAATWYMQWTSRLAIAKAAEFRSGKMTGERLAMYVLRDSERGGAMRSQDGSRKGYEAWVNDKLAAERLFTVMAFAHRQRPASIAGKFFGEPKPATVVAYSQAMIYNGNPQIAGVGGATQPQVGWDTLNWEGPAKEFDHPDHPRSGSILNLSNVLGQADPPKVKVNWQAKLVPVTPSHLKSAWQWLPADMRVRLPLNRYDASQLDTH